MILDTTFLVDIHREVNSRRRTGALAFLERSRMESYGISFISQGEFACGMGVEHRDEMQIFLSPYKVFEFSDEIAWTYSRIYRALRASGSLIGANDMWISATALTHDMPLVTRNAADFRRVPGLDVIDY